MSWLPFTDYQIKSTRILGGTIIASFLLNVLLFATDLLVDLRCTTPFILLPFLALNTVLLIAYFLDLSPRYLSIAWGLVQYLTIEAHFIFDPTTMHVIDYWMVVIPLGVIIMGGVRQAFGWLILLCLTIVANGIFAQNYIGSSYTVNIQIIPFVYAGIIFLVAVIASAFLLYNMLGNAYEEMKTKTDDLTAIQTLTNVKKAQLEKYQNALFTISKDSVITSGNLEASFEKICKLSVEILGVSRVSIWSYNKDQSCLERNYLFEVSGGNDDHVVLERKDFPRYFEAMQSKSFIAVTDAQTHPETNEFTEGYLKPLNIRSMLDCPITSDANLMGIICCEHQHENKQWSGEDILFVQSLSDIIAISVKAKQINRLLKQIRNQNHELMSKNNEIDTLNEELMATNEELTTINESLEVAVNKRTEELERQNNQLTEYAFINSHLLRAPLSRILGLSHLITLNGHHAPDPSLLEALIKSTAELDAITRKISELLYDGSNFSRDQIKEILDRNFKVDKEEV